ncbi:uncharacterized protein MYCFIDRAFT_170652 [Pseudocercospora fijiensis CIRAD86]|uniref:Uncharacterized protein n=1 Tax=Pseudocercospora fijiensis (strain CIRAD86) TaxID=383855 RepID=N1Q8E6_PSEFD|nr:uncharacterized protein MYCFIDRAFT_170652 [Pseudocercospora fijiensis CIRAD86]EME89139.1 hypothetical protein MYCFIDRAFT_170652 [Pseudocercospora fijiensis CIRAD86]
MVKVGRRDGAKGMLSTRGHTTLVCGIPARLVEGSGWAAKRTARVIKEGDGQNPHTRLRRVCGREMGLGRREEPRVVVCIVNVGGGSQHVPCPSQGKAISAVCTTTVFERERRTRTMGVGFLAKPICGGGTANERAVSLSSLVEKRMRAHAKAHFTPRLRSGD